MMRWIVDASLRFRRLVVALAVGVIALGAYQAQHTPVDALPEFSPPTVEVQTEALGLSAAEVEQLITVPLEQDLLVGVAFLQDIESVSLPGLSSVVMTFEPGTDLLAARQLVQERLTQAVGVAGLPAVAKTPQMIQPLSSSSRVSMVKLTANELTPIQMSVLARWVITPRLLGVSGVANVAIWGHQDRQLQVQVDPARLQQNHVTLSQVVSTTGNALEVSPLSYLEASKPGTGGFIDTANQRLNIFHEQAISSAEELAQVPLEGADGRQGGASGRLTLGDVTTVVEDHQPLIGDTACAGGQDCLLLVVEKFPGADSNQVSEDVEDALDALEPGLAGMQVDASVYQPASYVKSSLENLGWTLLAGAILLFLLLLAFFMDWRRLVIVAVGVAASAGLAVVVLDATGTTVNVMVLTGLVIGLTVVVDDAVTGADGLAHLIRRHREAGTPGTIWWPLVNGTVSSRSSLLYGSLIAAAATLPLFFLWGPGDAFVPSIVLSYLLALAASMVVALTVTPALALMLWGKTALRHRESAVVGRLRRRYDAAAPRFLTRVGVGLGSLGLLALAGLIAVPFLDTSLRPLLAERHVVVGFEAAPGTSLPRMTSFADQAVEALTGLPGVRDANALVGRAVMSDKDVDVDQGEVWVTLDADADYDETVAAIEDTMTRDPEVDTEVTTYSEQRVRDVLERQSDDVVVRVYGENPEVLDAKVEEIRQGLTDVDGISAVDVESTPQEPTIEVEVNLDRAQEIGMKPGDVRRAAAMLLGGITVGHLFQEQKVFDVVIWGAPEIRQTEADIAALRIDAPDGSTVRLGAVAEVRNVPNAAVIRHESVARYVDVTADAEGRDVDDVNGDVEAMIQDIVFPLDHHAEVLDGFAERQADESRLIAVGVAAAVAVFLLLQAAFRSWRLALLAFINLPIALSGGVLATLAMGGDLTLGSVAGLVAVLGIAARGVVLLFRRFQELEHREGVPFGPGVVMRGSADRFAPTLISTLAIAAVLLPLAVAGSAMTGLEVVHPAVVTFLGGLLTAAVVNLIALPSLYLRFGAGSDPNRWVDELLEPDVAHEPVRS